MNPYPPELHPEEEQESSLQSPVTSPRSRYQQAPPPRRSSGGSWMSRLTLLVSLLALIVSCVTLFLILRPDETPPEEEPPDVSAEEPVTFQFGDRVLTPLEGMPLNPYDRSAFTTDSRGRLVYEQDGKRAKTGVDVSTYQKEIDWQAVAADGIDFAILRLGYRGYTEGGLFLDKTFERNLQGALNAGLDVGVYFFSQAVTPEEAEQEADYVCSALDGYDITYPVAFDWEPISDESARTNGLDGETLTQCADAFCARVKEAGYTPAVYFNQSLGYLRYDLRELTDYALWLAEYDSKPDFYYHFDLWQYTHTGQVAGIEGNVDLDLDLR